MADWSETRDFVIIGSGGGSVPAALLMKDRGKSAVILEKQDMFGGSTAMSGGVAWIPDNSVAKEAGIADSPAAARAYLDACIGEAGRESTPARRSAFLETGPVLVDYLRARGMRFVHAEGYSDYHEGEVPGGNPRGRGLVAANFDLRRLGEWQSRVVSYTPLPFMVHEAAALLLEGRTARSVLTIARLAVRLLRNRLGAKLVGMGTAFVGRLLEIALREGIDIRLGCGVTRLIVEAGTVVGVEVEQDGKRRAIRASRGVLINAGGFARNDAMRARYNKSPVEADWSLSNPGDTGEIQQMAIDLGADTALLEQSWWVPTSLMPGGMRPAQAFDISKPHAILVDSAGQRFVNESTSYVTIGYAMYARNEKVGCVPCWCVTDSRHRTRYRWAGMSKGEPPAEWLESGYMVRAGTIAELARKCGIDPAGLEATIARFNRFAAIGEDTDFARGGSAYNRFAGDPAVKPNPNLGAIEQGPFYAVRIYPGDVGTAGGLVTDEDGRVLRPDGSWIERLYATGNSTAPVTGRSYPGPGASIAASMIFGFRAARAALGAEAAGSAATERADLV